MTPYKNERILCRFYAKSDGMNDEWFEATFIEQQSNGDFLIMYDDGTKDTVELIKPLEQKINADCRNCVKGLSNECPMQYAAYNMGIQKFGCTEFKTKG